MSGSVRPAELPESKHAAYIPMQQHLNVRIGSIWN
jgi:hypothetical protein